MDTDLQLILARLDGVAKDVELVRAEQKLGGVTPASGVSASSPWYVKWVQILGIPAVLLTILVSWGQFTLNTGSTEKTQAETQKVRVETAKTQAELEKALLDLERERTVAPTSSSLNETIVKLKQTLADATKLREAEVKGALTDIFVRFVIVWFVFQAVDLIYSIISAIWNLVFGSLMVVFVNLTSKIKGKAGTITRAVFPVFLSLASIFPRILLWYVQLFVVFTILQPIAFNAATIIGRSEEFTNFMAAFRQHNFHGAAEQLIALAGVTHP